jgi:hypothetical protein
VGYDEGVAGGAIVQTAISVNLQSGFQNQGAPDLQKNYQELQLDANTAGQDMTATLVFDDGEATSVIGTFNTVVRTKINFRLNGDLGFDFYKAALQITGDVKQRVYLYQAAIKALPLAKTRKTMDTYWLNLGGTDSKFARDVFFEYSATQTITFNVYYDGSSTAFFTFTLPPNGGVRTSIRQRLPDVSFRTIRIAGGSPGDFQIWNDSCIWYKFLCQGRGYEKGEFVPN